MAIFTTMEALEQSKHGIFRSSRLKSTDVGKILDLVINNGLTADAKKDIAVDRGTPVKAGARLNDGLQLREGTIAGVKDMVYIVGNPAIVKDAMTRFQEEEYNYFVKAGEVSKCYEVLGEIAEVFGVADYQFTTKVDDAAGVQFGNYVVVDGNGGYVELAAKPDAADYGFIGQVYGFEMGNNQTVVLIECIQNKQLA